MNLLEAVDKAEQNENIKKLKGYFLGSIFASINSGAKGVAEWTLLYYNPGTKSVVDCFVSEKFVTVGEYTPAIKEIERIDVDYAEIDIDDALQIAGNAFKKPSINTLVSLHKKEFAGKSTLVWTMAFITADMSATSFDVNAANGKILNEETTSLIRKM